MTHIDVATVDDIDDLVASVAGLFVEDGGRFDRLMDTTWPERGGAAYYKGLLGDPDCLLALARTEGRTLGHLVGKLRRPDDLYREPIAVLESIRVYPAARGGGVGTRLIEHFFAWARERDAAQASVTAFAANEGAQRLYRRHGFAPMSVTMRAPLQR